MSQKNSPAGNGASQSDNWNYNPANEVLNRLTNVKACGDKRWMACCPAHADKSPSLAVCEASSGNVLVHCFAGCHYTEVLDAIGMHPSDLFAESLSNDDPKKPSNYQSIHGTAKEALICLIAGQTILKGEVLARPDLERLAEAVSKLRAAARAVGYDI